MSVQAQTWAYEQQLPLIPKFLLVTLANWANQHSSIEHSCWPGQETLASQLGVTDRSVRKWLKWLEDEGFIRREHRQRTDGSRTSDHIYLLMPTGKLFRLEDRPTGTSATIQPEPAFRARTVRGTVREKEKKIDRKKRRSQIPETFTPSDEVVIKLRLEWSLTDIAKQRQRFIDYHRAKGNAFMDHDRAFQNWMRNAKEYRANGRASVETGIFGQPITDLTND